MQPGSEKRVLFWGAGEDGSLAGFILPRKAWQRFRESVLAAPASANPHFVPLVTGLDTLLPSLKAAGVKDISLAEFCYFRNAVFSGKRSPRRMELKISNLLKLVKNCPDTAPVELKRFAPNLEKGEYFSFVRQKERVELYYLLDPGEEPPLKLPVKILWRLAEFVFPLLGTSAPKGWKKVLRLPPEPFVIQLRRFLNFKWR